MTIKFMAFSPRKDITAYEIALVLEAIDLKISEDRIPSDIKRHFVDESTRIHGVTRPQPIFVDSCEECGGGILRTRDIYADNGHAFCGQNCAETFEAMRE